MVHKPFRALEWAKAIHKGMTPYKSRCLGPSGGERSTVYRSTAERDVDRGAVSRGTLGRRTEGRGI